MSPPETRPVATPAIPSLDGIRAIAVSLVFFAHSGLEARVPGGLGVTIFFVLSGYLITTLMRIEYARDGRIDYLAFYLRRGLRLVPPLLIITAAAGLAAWSSLDSGGFSRGGLLAVLFYLGNYFVISHDFSGVPAGIGVVWSLAVEEHFYLLYPPLAVLLLRRASRARAGALLGSACIAVLAWRTWLSFHGVSADYIGMATDTRIDAILAGCLMAFLRNPWLEPPRAARPRAEMLMAGAALALLLLSLAIRDERFRATARYSLQSLAVAPLIWIAIARSAALPLRWLNARPLVYLGQISYTVYLSHQVVLACLEKQWPQLGWTATTVAAAVLTLGIAVPMRQWVERPCARLRQRLHYRRTQLGHRAPAPETASENAPQNAPKITSDAAAWARQ